MRSIHISYGCRRQRVDLLLLRAACRRAARICFEVSAVDGGNSP
jgi:hypothetical protein